MLAVELVPQPPTDLGVDDFLFNGRALRVEPEPVEVVAYLLLQLQAQGGLSQVAQHALPGFGPLDSRAPQHRNNAPYRVDVEGPEDGHYQNDHDRQQNLRRVHGRDVPVAHSGAGLDGPVQGVGVPGGPAEVVQQVQVAHRVAVEQPELAVLEVVPALQVVAVVQGEEHAGRQGGQEPHEDEHAGQPVPDVEGLPALEDPHYLGVDTYQIVGPDVEEDLHVDQLGDTRAYVDGNGQDGQQVQPELQGQVPAQDAPPTVYAGSLVVVRDAGSDRQGIDQEYGHEDDVEAQT